METSTQNAPPVALDRLVRRCQASVFIKDVPRYTGRGRGGFSMHYTERQCSLRASKGDYCHHHAKFGDNGRCRWAEPFIPTNVPAMAPATLEPEITRDVMAG